MKSILSKLYDGEIYPAEQITTTDPKYRVLLEKVHETFEYLLKKLSEEDADKLEKMNDKLWEISGITDYDNFFYGYRLGVLMTMEVFTTNDKLITHTEP